MIMMNEKKEEVMVCPGCRRHCPVNALSCERGEACVKRMEAGEAEETMDYEETGRKHGRHDHGHEREYEGRGEGREGREGRRDDRRGKIGGGHCRHDRGHGHETEDHSLPGLFHRCSRCLFHRFGHNRTQDRVVKLLAEQGELTQRELREILDIRPGSVRELLSKLEEKGLIRCERDTEDRRKVVLRLTDQGMEYRALLAQPEEEEQMFGALTQEEQETLKALLEKLIDSWNETALH